MGPQTCLNNGMYHIPTNVFSRNFAGSTNLPGNAGGLSYNNQTQMWQPFQAPINNQSNYCAKATYNQNFPINAGGLSYSNNQTPMQQPFHASMNSQSHYLTEATSLLFKSKIRSLVKKTMRSRN